MIDNADTGLLGLTTKHIYFASNRKKFRVRYDRIVSFNPYDDEFGIMRDVQTANPQAYLKPEQPRGARNLHPAPTPQDPTAIPEGPVPKRRQNRRYP